MRTVLSERRGGRELQGGRENRVAVHLQGAVEHRCVAYREHPGVERQP